MMICTLMNKYTPVIELNIDDDTASILKVTEVYNLVY